MEKEEINEIVNRYAAGEATEKDSMFLENWYLSLNEDLPLACSLSTRLNYLEQVKSALDQKFGQDTDFIDIHLVDRKITINMWPYMLAVAATIICAICIMFYQTKRIELPIDPVLVNETEIKAGGNKAFLTLSNGEKINLSTVSIGVLTAQTGTEITKIKDGEIVYKSKYSNSLARDYNKLETPNGGVYQMHLPDGTTVWLNAASTLKYPTSFTSLKERRVELSGEAYFEVAKNQRLPFRVVTHNQVIEVLGTHFNVSSYKEESTDRTTLLEGRIKINKNVILKAGEQAVISGSGIKVTEVDAESAADWKNGKFSFNNGQDFQSAMHQIERWYDVKFVYLIIPDMEPRGRIPRTETLSTVLEGIEDMGKVHFKIEGRRIIVTQ